MIEILYGPIASGKSTYALARAREGAVIVNDDAITLAIHGGDYSLYDKVLKPLYKSLQLNMISVGVLAGRDVVIDSTALTRERRERLLLIARSFDVDCRLVVFRDGVFLGREDGVRRFAADSRGITLREWEEIGERHAELADSIDSVESLRYSPIRFIPWKE